MEPIETSLINFLSYKDETVNFESVDVAVVSGVNGSGKSSLITDSVTWCLFGEGSKGNQKQLDNYVKTGEKECKVTHIFRLVGNKYKVIRHRSKAKDKTMLEFFIEKNDKWEPLTGKSVSDTQDIIEKTIRMDYRTFTSSALILQGQADSFTKKMKDSERKETLTRILGLDLWDILLDRIKKDKSDYNGKLAVVLAEIAPLSEKASKKEALEELMHTAAELLKEYESNLTIANKKLSEYESKVATKQLLEDTIADNRLKISSLQKELGELLLEKDSIEKRIERLKKILENKDKVMEAVKSEENIKADIASIEIELGKKDILTTQRNDAKKQMAEENAETERIIESKKGIFAEWRTLDSLLLRKEEIQNACQKETQLKESLKEFEIKATQHMEISTQIETQNQLVNKWDSETQNEITKIEASIENKKPQVIILEVIDGSEKKFTAEQLKFRELFDKKDTILEACKKQSDLSESLKECEIKAAAYMGLTDKIQNQTHIVNKWDNDKKSEITILETEIISKTPLVETLTQVPCGSEMKSSCKLLLNARAAADEIISLQSKLDKAKGDTNPHTQVLEGLTKERETLNYNPEEHNECKQALEEVRKTSELKLELEIAEKMLSAAKVLKVEIDQLQNELNTVMQRINPNRKLYEDLVQKRADLSYNAEAHKECKQQIIDISKVSSQKTELDLAENKKNNLKDKLSELDNKLLILSKSTSDEKFKGYVAALDELEKQAKALEAKKQELVDIQKISKLKTELDQAEGLLPELNSAIAKNTERNEAICSEIIALNLKITTVVNELDNIQLLEKDILKTKEEINALKESEAVCRKHIGTYEQSISEAQEAASSIEILSRQVTDYKEEILVCELLEEACGKKSGVPAFIIENAVPEIERLSNEKLNEMTAGQFQIRLDTQIEGKSTGVMQDVLRITVLDSGVDRPYETYSGAEKFMIDISIRVAISKFLAHRAGAEIRLLVIDEGFGSLDAAGRFRVMETIKAIKKDFAKVIIITHLEELKESFPTRIEVTKSHEGSKVRIVA